MQSAELPLATLDHVACFETLRAYQGRLFGLEGHLRRLGESCRALGKSLPVLEKEIQDWCRESLAESGWTDAIFRLSVHWENERKGRLVAILKAFEPYPESFYERGIQVRTAVQRRWTLKAQDPQMKTSQFMSGVLAVLDRGHNEANELIFLSQIGAVTEGTVSNIFIFKEKRLLTPSVSSGILRGVTRGAVIELAKKRGWESTETCLTRHDLYNAEECFLTSTLTEILPVVWIDGRRIGAGKPGPVTTTLLADFRTEKTKR